MIEWGYIIPAKTWFEDPEDYENKLAVTGLPTMNAQHQAIGRSQVLHPDELLVLADHVGGTAWVTSSPMTGCLRLAGVWRPVALHSREDIPSLEDLWCHFRPLPRAEALELIVEAMAGIVACGCQVQVTAERLRARYASPSPALLEAERAPAALLAEDGRVLLTAGPAMGFFRTAAGNWQAPGHRTMPGPILPALIKEFHQAAPDIAAWLSEKALQA